MVLVAEDDAVFAALVGEVLATADLDVLVASDGARALALAREQRPVAAILDVNLPELSGYEVCRGLRELYGESLPILFLSGERREDFDRVAGLMIGADDYLVKPFAPEELLARIRALLRRGREPAEVLAFGDLVLEVSTRSVQRGDRRLVLSGREAALLELLLRNSRQVVSRELALERVWGGVTAASPNVVDRYVNYLRRKLGEPPLIQAVRGTGFILGR